MDTRTLLRAAVLLAATLPVSAVPAGAGAPTTDGAAARARAMAARLDARAQHIRADLTSGRFERVITRLATMAGLPSPEGTDGPAPGADLRALPPGVAGPVADLLGAAALAAGQVRAAAAEDRGRSLDRSRHAQRLAERIAFAMSRGERWPVERARDLKREVTAGPVLRASARGGLAIGRALDRSLPALRAAAAALPPGPAAAACDVADQRPLLCVNGTGPNAVDAEAVLVVDLGGDDTYTSSAGGASSARCVDDPEDTSCNASVLVDLGGDDTYVLDQAISHDHMVGAGSALTGVGVLVDAAGDDAYLARVPDRQTSLDQSYVFGSGNTGLGLLADLAGDDRYELTGASKDTYSPYTHGASLTGMGALLDMDGANTYRTVITGEQQDDPERPLIENDLIQSMGVGVFGGGALVDRTGYATFEARVDITAGQREETNTAGVVAQGVGLIGDAALFAGAGPTTYRAEARRVASAQIPGRSSEPEPDEYGELPPTGRLPGSAAATAQGVAALGFVVMEDAGGDDTYLDHARTEHHLTAVAEEGCGCDRAIATLDVTGDYSASAGVSTQGVGSAIFAPDAGVILHDRGGDDTYSARAEMIITSRAENRLADPGVGARAEAIPYSYPGLNAFGQGLGSDFAPTVLQDDGGDDTYELVTMATTDASADTGGGPATARAVGSQPNTHGQGSSYWDPAHGALIDLGGQDDYQAHAISRATTWPNPGAWDVPRTIAAQGGVGGTLVDLDEGIADTFAATPERGPGVGVRGEGPGWVDVLNTFPGYGVAPLQPPRADVTLTMDPANPTGAEGGVVPFRARLTDQGAPVAGAELIFDLEYQGVGLAGAETWVPYRFRSHGITDAQGWATGYLDLDEYLDWYAGSPPEPLRVAARFHGDGQRRTALATQPFAFSGDA